MNKGILTICKRLQWSEQLKASTLVETIVAMVIIVIAFGTAMLLYMQVTNSEQLLSRSRAHVLLQQLAEESKVQKHFETVNFEHRGLQIKKQCQAYPDYPGTLLLSLEAFTPKGELLATYREIVLSDAPPHSTITKNEYR